MCNEFNRGLFLSYIRDPFKAAHSAETIRGKRRKRKWIFTLLFFFVLSKSWNNVRRSLTSHELAQRFIELGGWTVGLCSSTLSGRFLQGEITLKLRTIVQIVQLFQELVTLQKKASLLQKTRKKINNIKELNNAPKGSLPQSSCDALGHVGRRARTRHAGRWCGHKGKSAPRAANQLAGGVGVGARCRRDAARKNPPVGRSGGAMASTSRRGGRPLLRARAERLLSLVRRCGARGDFSQ